MVSSFAVRAPPHPGRAGMVTYKKLGKGEYEKVGLGPGPRILSEETLPGGDSNDG